MSKRPLKIGDRVMVKGGSYGITIVGSRGVVENMRGRTAFVNFTGCPLAASKNGIYGVDLVTAPISTRHLVRLKRKAKSDLIPLESIKRLNVKKGETLVVRMPDGTNMYNMSKLATAFSKALPGVKTLIVAGGIELQTVSADTQFKADVVVQDLRMEGIPLTDEDEPGFAGKNGCGAV